ncbi:hypothetical protein ELH02_14150 [Rhizobium ruizarguesonis]|uniref:hypothetical protein n=1 Tax=Rhizobium ruizarguesonis TaxID=2081791 RepID=UPI001030798B|nr:hypothetical protein [Rhizobium ruizarguesonis]TBE45432.1 hypothetical protein ELH02_14150 [Rhizobium ruizarguesonis]
MTLWIESITERFLSASDPKRLPFKQRMALLKKGWTADDMKSEALYLAFRTDAARDNWVEPNRDFSPSDMTELHADFRRRLAPLILPELAHLPIAFDVDARTVAEFAGAEIKESVSEFARARLLEWPLTYFDFPERTAALEDDWFVRAVIISQESSTVSKWSAVIQNAPDSKAIVLTWYSVENEGYFSGSLIGYSDDFSRFESCVQWSEFVANLVYLCVAWFGTGGVNNKFPHPEKCGRNVDEAVSQAPVTALAKPSRFRLISLAPPEAQRLRKQGAMGGNKLSQHIKVRGHFKLVRYGKRWAYQRLQWVNSYEKGPRHQPLETRVALYKLQAAS